MRKREEGMMTVEAVLSLVPFIIAVLGIISFINIFAVHNKIQYAPVPDDQRTDVLHVFL